MPYQSDIIDLAIEFAAVAHEGQHRKGTNVPYISHPTAVGMILLRAGCDEHVVAAGILHDTVEDTEVTIHDIEQQFGRAVAELVWAASEPDKSAKWEDRKTHTIEALRTASLEQKMLVCADKLHNALSILRELENIGEAVWEKFSRNKEKQEWYYRNIIESLGYDGEIKLLRELRSVVDSLFSSSRQLQAPSDTKQAIFFETLLRNIHNEKPDTYVFLDNHPEWKEPLKALHKRAEAIRRDGTERMDALARYLAERGATLRPSEESDEIFSFCVAVKELYGLYNYQLWPHVRRMLKKMHRN